MVRLEFGLTSAILRTSITLDENSGIKYLGFLKGKRDLESSVPLHQLSRRLGSALLADSSGTRVQGTVLCGTQGVPIRWGLGSDLQEGLGCKEPASGEASASHHGIDGAVRVAPRE